MIFKVLLILGVGFVSFKGFTATWRENLQSVNPQVRKEAVESWKSSYFDSHYQIEELPLLLEGYLADKNISVRHSALQALKDLEKYLYLDLDRRYLF